MSILDFLQLFCLELEQMRHRRTGRQTKGRRAIRNGAS